MGWLDDLFGGSTSAPSAAAPPPPAPASNYADFLKQYTDAAAASERAAPPKNLWSWLNGDAHDAAVANAAAAAPAAWQANQQGDAATKEAQIGLLRSLAAASAMTGQPIDPNNIMGSAAAMGAYGAGTPPPPGQPSPQQAPPAPAPAPAPAAPPAAAGGLPMPAGGQPLQPDQAPQGQPQAQPGDVFQRLASAAGATGLPPASAIPPAPPQAAPAAPDAQQVWRANTIRMGRIMLMNPQTAAAGEDMIKQASVGLPAGAQVLPDGSVAPVRMANGQTAQQYDAQGAGMTSGAQASAQVGPHNAEAAFKGRVDMGVHAANADVDAAHQRITVQGPDGHMHSVLAGQLPGGTAPLVGFSDPETHTAQIKEVQDTQSAGSEAATQQATVQTLGNALRGSPLVGPGAATMQSALSVADSLGLLGPQAKAELGNMNLAKMSSVEVAGVLAKAISGGRTPLGIFNQIAAAKPSLATSEPWKMIDAINQDLQRAQDKARFVAEYYGNNAHPNSLDAASAFDKAFPVQMYVSRVTPTPAPAKPANRQVGYTYTNPAGASAIWTGTGWSTQ